MNRTRSLTSITAATFASVATLALNVSSVVAHGLDQNNTLNPNANTTDMNVQQIDQNNQHIQTGHQQSVFPTQLASPAAARQYQAVTNPIATIPAFDQQIPAFLSPNANVVKSFTVSQPIFTGAPLPMVSSFASQPMPFVSNAQPMNLTPVGQPVRKVWIAYDSAQPRPGGIPLQAGPNFDQSVQMQVIQPETSTQMYYMSTQ